MIASYNISTPQVYQSHTNMIFFKYTHLMFHHFRSIQLFIAAFGSTKVLLASGRDGGGPWVEDWELTTNTPGKHGVFEIDFYRVMIHPFGENKNFVHNSYQE